MDDAIIVFAGGEHLRPSLVSELPEPTTVYAADSGYDNALRLGYRVERVIGDLDSISAVPPDEVAIERHPTDKDATDLELAMRAAYRAEPERIVVVGGEGGRLDHALAVATTVASPEWAGVEVDWIHNHGTVHVVREETRELHGDEGRVISLIPVGGDARGVTTTGLRWPLDDDVLAYGTTRGVSNRFSSPIATVTVAEGCLLVVIPR